MGKNNSEIVNTWSLDYDQVSVSSIVISSRHLVRGIGRDAFTLEAIIAVCRRPDEYKKEAVGALGIPMDSKNGLTRALEIPRQSNKG
jgi:hypothetical protein